MARPDGRWEVMMLRELTITALLVASMGAVAAESSAPAPVPEAAPAPRWDWTVSHRFAAEAEIVLPTFMWVSALANQDTRLSAAQISGIFACAPGVAQGKRSFEVVCKIEDFALRGAKLPGDRPITAVLEEYDALLTGETLRLQVTPDGRLLNVGIGAVKTPTRRINRLRENQRLLLLRALSGLDTRFSRQDGVADAKWVVYDSRLAQLPSARGSAGSVEVIAQVEPVNADGVSRFQQRGRGVMIPGEEGNQYYIDLRSVGHFDTVAGELVDRTWTVLGEATPSSGQAVGYAAVPYVQFGRLMRLGPEDEFDVGVSKEIEGLDQTQSALQQWQFLGTARR